MRWSSFNIPTIFNYLTQAKKSWGIYYEREWQGNQCYTAYTFPQIQAAQQDNEVAPACAVLRSCQGRHAAPI